MDAEEHTSTDTDDTKARTVTRRNDLLDSIRKTEKSSSPKKSRISRRESSGTTNDTKLVEESETDHHIATLIQSIGELTEITRRQVQVFEKYQQNGEGSVKEESNDRFQRSTVRLDGIEVYAVVSALTVASSIACIEAYGDINSNKKGTYSPFDFGEFLHYVFMLSNAISIFTGLHATLVFSLVTMYGRTAIGLGRDKAFHSFVTETGFQRYRGFQTFLWSLYAFAVQCGVMIVTRFVPNASVYAKLSALVIVSTIISPTFLDTYHIVEKAKMIFSSDQLSESVLFR